MRAHSPATAAREAEAVLIRVVYLEPRQGGGRSWTYDDDGLAPRVGDVVEVPPTPRSGGQTQLARVCTLGSSYKGPTKRIIRLVSTATPTAPAFKAASNHSPTAELARDEPVKPVRTSTEAAEPPAHPVGEPHDVLCLVGREDDPDGPPALLRATYNEEAEEAGLTLSELVGALIATAVIFWFSSR